MHFKRVLHREAGITMLMAAVTGSKCKEMGNFNTVVPSRHMQRPFSFIILCSESKANALVVTNPRL